MKMNSFLANNLYVSVFQKIILTFFVVYCSVFAGADPITVQAQTEYELLAPIPLTDPTGKVDETTNTAKFLPGLFKLMIAVATGLAVIMLIYAGVKYMSTDAFSGKEEAKGIIENTLWGLLLAMSAWLILNTINPELVNFNLNIEKQEIRGKLEGGKVKEGSPVPAGACPNCGLISIPHKQPERFATGATAAERCGREGGCGCAFPGPCTIQTELNNRLKLLHGLQSLYVTESYPPTRTHQAGCHQDGSCVDATITNGSEANIKRFIENAAQVNLKAQFETTTEKRAEDIRKATGLSKSQVFYVPGITGEHFSIYYK